MAYLTLLNLIRCEGPVCEDPGRPIDGFQIAKSYEQGSEVLFGCSRPGYILINPRPISCIRQPEWQGRESQPDPAHEEYLQQCILCICVFAATPNYRQWSSGIYAKSSVPWTPGDFRSRQKHGGDTHRAEYGCGHDPRVALGFHEVVSYRPINVAKVCRTKQTA